MKKFKFRFGTRTFRLDVVKKGFVLWSEGTHRWLIDASTLTEDGSFEVGAALCSISPRARVFKAKHRKRVS